MKFPFASNPFYFNFEHKMISWNHQKTIKMTKIMWNLSFIESPMKNHESLLQVTNRLIEFIKKEEVTYDCFSLIGAENIPGFINITKVITINPDEEEIWINQVTYKDREHRTLVVEKISKDKECQDIYEEFIRLLTPGTGFISGEFRNLAGG